MLWLVLAWSGLFFLVIGAGLGVTRLLGRLAGGGFRHASVMQTFWFGYAALVANLEMASLAFPIRGSVLVVVTLFALAGYGLGWRAIGVRLTNWRRRPWRALAVALLVALITSVVAASASRPVTWFDTYLYHLQVVKWTVAYPAVPGLANLHARLAFNNSAHLFAALTESLWAGQSAHLALGFLVLATALHHLEFLVGRKGGVSAMSRATAAITIIYLAALVATHQVASLSTDGALAMLVVSTVLEWTAWRPAVFRWGTSLALILVLATLAFTTKLGGLPLLMVALLWIAWIAWKGRGRPRVLLALSLLPAVLLLGFFARQVVLSGWLMFPMPVGDLHVPWSFPREQLLSLFQLIKSWARMPNHEASEVMSAGFLHWFRPWFAGFATSRESRLLLAAMVLLSMSAVSRRLRPSWSLASSALPVAWIASLASLVFWFLGAPDLRFGRVFFWLVLATTAAPVLARTLSFRAGRVLVVVTVLWMAHWAGALAIQWPVSPFALPPLARFESKPVALPSGLIVLVPVAANDRCGDAELPCTPMPGQQRLRWHGKVGAGFLP